MATMSKVYRFWVILLSMIGGCSLLYAVVVLVTMGWQPTYLYFWVGLFLLCLILVIGIRLSTRNGKTPPKWLVIPVEMIVLMFCLIFIVIEAIIIHNASQKPEEGADYLIVLGAKVNGDQPSLTLRQRIEAAAEYLRRNPNTIVIASGGKGSDEDRSEAQCIYEQLVSLGIEPERILLEDQSTSTEENMRFSAELIQRNRGQWKDDLNIEMEEYEVQTDDHTEQAGSGVAHTGSDVVEQERSAVQTGNGITESVVLTTTDFHIYRSLYLAEKQGYENVTGNPARSAWWLIPTNYTREFMAVVKDVVIKGLM